METEREITNLREQLEKTKQNALKESVQLRESLQAYQDIFKNKNETNTGLETTVGELQIELRKAEREITNLREQLEESMQNAHKESV